VRSGAKLAGVEVPADELRAVFGGADIAEVSVASVYEPVASASRGIWRVRCGADSAILKLVAHADGDHGNWQSGEDVSHWYYWRREVDAYDSGLLESLPGGLRAPKPRLVTPRADGSVALWLADLRGEPAVDWEIGRYRIAARHLGQTQGVYAASRLLPDEPWLSREWLRAYLTQRDGDLAFVTDEAAWRQPQIEQWFAAPPVERLVAMRDSQSRFLDALDGMPRTLSHFDFHPGNLFAAGDEVTVAIDWAFVGVGALGEDAGNLVPDAVLDFHLEPVQLDDLYETVLAGYTEGLRDAGWRGPADGVRLALAATMAAKYAWIAPAMLRVVAEGRPTLNGRPTEEALRWWAPTVGFLLERADEAGALARSA
jgi:Phosphotransferase enzyme family